MVRPRDPSSLTGTVYVGHYALGCGLAAVRPRRGGLTLLVLAAIAPDLPSAAFAAVGVKEPWAPTHGWSGLAVIAGVLVVVAVLAGLDKTSAALGAMAVVSHAVLDAAAQWLYRHPWTDCVIEVGALVVAAALFGFRAKLAPEQRSRWWILCGTVAALQITWDAILAVGVPSP